MVIRKKVLTITLLALIGQTAFVMPASVRVAQSLSRAASKIRVSTAMKKYGTDRETLERANLIKSGLVDPLLAASHFKPVVVPVRLSPIMTTPKEQATAETAMNQNLEAVIVPEVVRPETVIPKIQPIFNPETVVVIDQSTKSATSNNNLWTALGLVGAGTAYGLYYNYLKSAPQQPQVTVSSLAPESKQTSSPDVDSLAETLNTALETPVETTTPVATQEAPVAFTPEVISAFAGVVATEAAKATEESELEQKDLEQKEQEETVQAPAPVKPTLLGRTKAGLNSAITTASGAYTATSQAVSDATQAVSDCFTNDPIKGEVNPHVNVQATKEESTLSLDTWKNRISPVIPTPVQTATSAVVSGTQSVAKAAYTKLRTSSTTPVDATTPATESLRFNPTLKLDNLTTENEFSLQNWKNRILDVSTAGKDFVVNAPTAAKNAVKAGYAKLPSLPKLRMPSLPSWSTSKTTTPVETVATPIAQAATQATKSSWSSWMPNLPKLRMPSKPSWLNWSTSKTTTPAQQDTTTPASDLVLSAEQQAGLDAFNPNAEWTAEAMN